MKYISFVVILLLSQISLLAQRDTLITTNGQIIMGDIKNMSEGVIQIETDYSDSDFKIEWNKVKEIHSKHNFTIVLSSGPRFLGTLNGSSDSLIIFTKYRNRIRTNGKEVVNIEEFNDRILDRFNVSFDLGINLTKANNLRQLTLQSYFGYHAPDWRTSAFFDIVLSDQDSVAQTKRIDGNLTYKFYLQSHWYAGASSDFLQNEEQKLKLRATPRLEVGNHIIQTNRAYLSVGGGLAWNFEYYADAQSDDRNNKEAFLNTELNMFDFDDFGFFLSLVVFKSLNDNNRIRTDFKFDLKYDLPYDFYIKFGYTYNFDSQPIENASNSDYVLKTTFGWEL